MLILYLNGFVAHSTLNLRLQKGRFVILELSHARNVHRDTRSLQVDIGLLWLLAFRGLLQSLRFNSGKGRLLRWGFLFSALLMVGSESLVRGGVLG
jgi:hypothetical protein